jgi:uncharacterized protein (DUF433 family)
MRHNKVFDIAVQQFLEALRSGDSIEALWENLAELDGLNPADLQRALQRAEQLEAEAEGWAD